MAQRKGFAPIVLGATGVGQKALVPVIQVTENGVHVDVRDEHTAGIGFWADVDAAVRREDGKPRHLFISVQVAKL